MDWMGEVALKRLVGPLAVTLFAGCAETPRATTPPPTATAPAPAASDEPAPPPPVATVPAPSASGPHAPPPLATPSADEAAALATWVGRVLAGAKVDTPHTAFSFRGLATGMTVAATKRRVPFRLVGVEWHGNPLGDRWQEAAELEHPTDASEPTFEVASLDFFDGRAARIDVVARRAHPARDAAAVCAIAAGAVTQPFVASACACRPKRLSDLESGFLPTATRTVELCEPKESSGFSFEDKAKRPWGGMRGLVVVTKTETLVELRLEGPAKLARDRAIDRARDDVAAPRRK